MCQLVCMKTKTYREVGIDGRKFSMPLRLGGQQRAKQCSSTSDSYDSIIIIMTYYRLHTKGEVA